MCRKGKSSSALLRLRWNNCGYKSTADFSGLHGLRRHLQSVAGQNHSLDDVLEECVANDLSRDELFDMVLNREGGSVRHRTLQGSSGGSGHPKPSPSAGHPD